MPKILSDEEKTERAIKKHNTAVAVAARAVTAELCSEQPQFIVKALKAHGKATVEAVKALGE